MASKKAKTKAAPGTQPSVQHSGPVKNLETFPKEALKNIVHRLNYPTLQMLRATCKIFANLLSEKEIHNVFLDLRIDTYMVPMSDDYECEGRCDACINFCGEETSGVEHASVPKIMCKACGTREYVPMRRPGVVSHLAECSGYDYDCCGGGGEASGGPMGICAKCFGLTGKQRSGKAKRKAFSKNYGGWLYMLWLDSASRNQEEKDDASDFEGDI